MSNIIMSTFDLFYNNKMSFGKYQLIVAILGCFLFLLMGSFLLLFPFVTRFIQNEYLFTFNQAALIDTSANIGRIIGGLVMSPALSHFGRKKIINFTILMAAMIGVFVFWADSLMAFMIIYMCAGLLIMLILNGFTIFMVETFTGRNKGKLTVLVFSFISLGRILAAVLLWYFLSEPKNGSWKIPFLCISILFSFLLTPFLLFLKESIKFNFYKKLYKKAFDDFQAVQSYNHRQSHLVRNKMVLSYNEFLEMGQVHEDSIASEDASTGAYEQVNHNKNIFLLSVLAILTNYSAVGQVTAVPNILGTNSSVLFANLVIVSGELLGAVFTSVFIDHPKVGRKRLIMISHVVMVGLWLVPILLTDKHMYFIFYLSKIFAKTSVSTLTIHMSESFPIRFREKSVGRIEIGLGFSFIIFPFLFFSCLKNGSEFVYGAFVVLSVLGCFAAVFVPDDLASKAKLGRETCETMIRNQT